MGSLKFARREENISFARVNFTICNILGKLRLRIVTHGNIIPISCWFPSFSEYFAQTCAEQHANEQRKMIKSSFDALQNLLQTSFNAWQIFNALSLLEFHVFYSRESQYCCKNFLVKYICNEISILLILSITINYNANFKISFDNNSPNNKKFLSFFKPAQDNHPPTRHLIPEIKTTIFPSCSQI